MLRRPATTLTLSKDEVSELINQLQEQALEERLKARIPKGSNGTDIEGDISPEIQAKQKGVPVGLWKNSPLKSSLHQLEDLDNNLLERRSEIQREAASEPNHEENPFYQPEQD
ncbi:anaphase-promoting complex subunit Cdc26p [Monosporozyma servazzii]